MIQDIMPQKLHNEYHPCEPEMKDYIMAFRENQIYIKEGEKKLEYPTYEQIVQYCETHHLPVPQFQYLFSVNDEKFFYGDLSEISLNGFAYEKMFQIRSMEPMSMMYAGATAYHLHVWYDANRFCGRCGEKLIHGKKERMLSCPACQNLVFPKIAPAIIVGVTHGDKILMTRYQGREYKRYALIAGFTEIGETAEETVKREVMEEVGLKVKNIKYYKSQPWGFDSNLLLGYFAELKQEEPIQLDTEELSTAEWVSYEEIPEDTEHISLTWEMMQYFKQTCAKNNPNL